MGKLALEGEFLGYFFWKGWRMCVLNVCMM